MSGELRVYPFSRERLGGTFYYACIRLDGKPIRTLTGFSSVKEAREEAQRLVNQYQAGEITLEDIKDFRARSQKVQGKTLREWAEHFNVSPQALSKAAKNKGLTLEQEVLKRLPINERWQP